MASWSAKALAVRPWHACGLIFVHVGCTLHARSCHGNKKKWMLSSFMSTLFCTPHMNYMGFEISMYNVISRSTTDDLPGMALWVGKAMYVGLFHACGIHLVRIIRGFHKAHILWTNKCTRSSPGHCLSVGLSVCPSVCLSVRLCPPVHALLWLKTVKNFPINRADEIEIFGTKHHQISRVT